MRLVITKSCVWVKSCVLKTLRERASIMDLIRSILQKFMGALGYPLGVSVQIPNCPSANVFRDRTVHSTLGHLSSLHKLLLPLISVLLQDHHSLPFKCKSLFSFVIRWTSSSSSSFFVFFNGPSSVIFYRSVWIKLILLKLKTENTVAK